MAAMVKQEYPEPSALQEILPDNQLGLEEYMDSADALTQPAILEDGRSIEESGAVETPNLENTEPKISPTDGDQDFLHPNLWKLQNRPQPKTCLSPQLQKCQCQL